MTAVILYFAIPSFGHHDSARWTAARTNHVNVLASDSQSPCTPWFLQPLPVFQPLLPGGTPTGARAGHPVQIRASLPGQITSSACNCNSQNGGISSGRE